MNKIGSYLPKSWVAAPLAEIADINPTFGRAEISDDTEVSFVPMPAVSAETGAIDVSAKRSFGDVKKGFTPFKEGDVLFAKITPCMENGKMAVVPKVANGYAFGSTEFHVLRPHSGLNARYLYYFISSDRFRRDAERNMTGAVGQRRVPKNWLANQSLPLPPLTEQIEIVAAVDALFSELDRAMLSLKKSRASLALFRHSVLKQALEGKLTSDERDGAGNTWKPTRLGDVLEFLTSGSRGWAKHYSAAGDVFIRAQNLKRDRLDLSDIAYVSLPPNSEGIRTRVKSGDVLVTITGANVTKTAIVERDIGAAYVSQHVALVRPAPELDPGFLYWFLIAESKGRRQLKDFAYGAGKPGLNLDNIRSVQIDVPPPEVQTAIVSKIESLVSVVEATDRDLDAHALRIDALRSAILSNAFAGKLNNKRPLESAPIAVLSENSRKPRKRKVA